MRLYHDIPHPALENFGNDELEVIVNEENKSFLDAAIYSRNRCFHIFLSSKFGSNRILQLMLPNTYCISSASSVLRHSFVTLPLKCCTKIIDRTFSEPVQSEVLVKNSNCIMPRGKSNPNSLLLKEFNKYCTNGVATDIVKIQPPYVIVRTSDHYCPYVSRQHESNFIYFLINLRTIFLYAVTILNVLKLNPSIIY